MSDTIDLTWIGTTLRSIQAEQRTLRTENELLRTSILNSLGDVVRVLNDRIGTFEALSDNRLDQLASRDQLLEMSRLLMQRIQNSDALMQALFENSEGLTKTRIDQLETRMDARLDEIVAAIRAKP